jgi:hypothetical protein
MVGASTRLSSRGKPRDNTWHVELICTHVTCILHSSALANITQKQGIGVIGVTGEGIGVSHPFVFFRERTKNPYDPYASSLSKRGKKTESTYKDGSGSRSNFHCRQ